MSDYVEPEVVRVRRSDRGAYILLAPAMILLFVFFLWPVVWVVSISPTEYDPMTGTRKWVTQNAETQERSLVGLSSYREVLASPAVWRSILNTTYFSLVYVPLTLLGSGAIALLLRRPVRARRLARSLFCLPCVVPAVGAALIWRAAYAPYNGSIDRLLYLLGYDHGSNWAGWLGEPYLAMPCIAVMCVWRDAGFFALIFLAALARIPGEMYEMAEVDGASKWTAFASITVPACLGTISLALVMLVINVQNVFQEIYVMTENGGPANWTLNMSFLVYRKVYEDRDWGHGAALSVILFAVTVVLILVQNRMLNRRLDWS